MNDHQQVARYIFEKLSTVQIVGNESETLSSAKQWATMIANGMLVVSQPEKPDETDSDIPDTAAANGSGDRQQQDA